MARICCGSGGTYTTVLDRCPHATIPHEESPPWSQPITLTTTQTKSGESPRRQFWKLHETVEDCPMMTLETGLGTNLQNLESNKPVEKPLEHSVSQKKWTLKSHSKMSAPNSPSKSEQHKSFLQQRDHSACMIQTARVLRLYYSFFSLGTRP